MFCDPNDRMFFSLKWEFKATSVGVWLWSPPAATDGGVYGNDERGKHTWHPLVVKQSVPLATREQNLSVQGITCRLPCRLHERACINSRTFF